jgi:hypothetical protein
MAKSSRTAPKNSRAPIQRKPRPLPPVPQPPEPVPPPPPPPPAFPDPWYPDVSVHFFGLNWDLEHLPDGDVKHQLEEALRRAFPGASSRPAFDDQYSGVGTSVSLSLGLWFSPQPGLYSPADAARRRGLLELRSTGHRQYEAEVLLSDTYINNVILSKIPSRLGGNGVPELTLLTSSVAIALPATLHVAATYDATLPILGNVQPMCSTNLSFGASGGNLNLTVSRLDCGDFDLGQTLVPQLANFCLWPLFLLGGIALGGYAIYNLANGLPALPPLPSLPTPDLANLLPREIPINVEMLRFAYSRPDFTTRGTTPGLGVLHVPIGWIINQRQPRLVVHGPAVVDLPLGTAEVGYQASTAEMVNPSFTWLVNSVVQPGVVDSSVLLTLDAQTPRLGTRRSFVVEARAVDGLVSSLQASNGMTTVGRVTTDL